MVPTNKLFSLSVFVLFISVVAYALFSYSLTAPNLVLSSWKPYWQFQTYMWKTFFNNRELLAHTFLIISSLFVSGYAMLLIALARAKNYTISKNSFMVILALLTVPLLAASTALSYDVFNYMFNSKMVLVYNVNPHQVTAQTFLDDPWTRFMHNIHTPAPYGYGWTLLSLVPYAAGFGKLLSTWFSFKAFSLLSYLLLAACYYYFLPAKQRKLSLLVLLHPLLLIEVLGNVHNDLWMMVPAMFSLFLVTKLDGSLQQKILTIFGSLLLLVMSISIKLATVTLLPIWLMLVLTSSIQTSSSMLKRAKDLFRRHWTLLASVALFIPLLTARSKYFLPWYATWSLVWIPFIIAQFNRTQEVFIIKISVLWSILIVSVAISSLFRYYPFLLANNYEGSVISEQILITWIGGLLIWITSIIVIVVSRQTKFLSSDAKK